MKFNSIFCIVFFIFCSSFSQNSFEKGYLMTTSGEKIEGFVALESNLKSSKESISYRKDLKAQSEYYQLSQIEVIYLDRGVKYIKENIEYDIDYVEENKGLTKNFDRNLVSETVLLEVLLEGEANLYSFVKNEKKLFYVKKNSQNIEYLFYKKVNNSEGLVKENAFFRQQLFEKFKCNSDDSIVQFLEIEYKTEDLILFFERFNTCKGNSSYSQSSSKQKPIFKIAPLVGVMFNNYDLSSDDSRFQIIKEDYSKTSMFFGVELSLKFPKNNFRYEIFGRLFYTKSDFKKYLLDDNVALNRKEEIEYTFNSGNINFAIGPRYFFGSYSKSRFFVDIAFGVIIPGGDLESKNTTTNITGGNTFEEVNKQTYDASLNFVPSIGFGYLYADKFGVDIRMDVKNNFTKSYNEIKLTQLPFYASIKYLFF